MRDWVIGGGWCPTFLTLNFPPPSPYKASCVIAGIKPLAVSIHETALIYTIHNHTDDFTDIDEPLKKEEWSHPVERITVDKVGKYKIENFNDGVKLKGRWGLLQSSLRTGKYYIMKP